MGIDQRLIDRINELARKQKETGLNEEELLERDRLRREYINAYKENLRGQLDIIRVVDEKGNKIPLKKKNKS